MRAETYPRFSGEEEVRPERVRSSGTRASEAMKTFTLAAVLAAALGVLALVPGPAQAHPPGHHSSGYGGYYGGGRHDVVPHWHRTYTPYGSYSWYGLGRHDFRPHSHSVTPYYYRGHHYSPWGYTESYYPRYRAYSYYGGW